MEPTNARKDEEVGLRIDAGLNGEPLHLLESMLPA